MSTSSAVPATRAMAATSPAVRSPAIPRWTARLPEPGRFWIRYAPGRWKGPERLWLDLAAGRPGKSSRPDTASGSDEDGQPSLGDLLGTSEPPLDDVLYLPPVPEHLADWRDALAERALAGGTPVLVQLLPGDETRLPRATAPGAAGAVVVVDLLAALLPGGFLHEDGPAEPLAVDLSGIAAAVWPLLPGLTDEPAHWERACERLAASGLGCLQALAPAFGPGDRRRLAQGSREGAFEALFHRGHREPPPERDFARIAHRHGLAPFLPRPLPRPPWQRVENRRIAGRLALAAELWLRLGRPVEQAQSLFRAARWLDATPYDVDALRREGNLAVVTALDPLARRIVAEAAGGGEPALLGELLAEYLGP
ncbi:MAG TPA: hypothetical protein VJA16_17325 [Thermoanaerobaculia bacterium]